MALLKLKIQIEIDLNLVETMEDAETYDNFAQSDSFERTCNVHDNPDDHVIIVNSYECISVRR